MFLKETNHQVSQTEILHLLVHLDTLSSISGLVWRLSNNLPVLFVSA